MPDSTRSGGLLLYEGNTANDLEVLIAHPGGPFFKNRDNLVRRLKDTIGERFDGER